jgi:hypothetical protein
MPCEDNQECVMAPATICETEPCPEIPPCMGKQLITYSWTCWCIGSRFTEKETDEDESIEKDTRIIDTKEKEVETNDENMQGIETGHQLREEEQENDCNDVQCTIACPEGQDYLYDTSGCRLCQCVNSTACAVSDLSE